MDVPDGARVSSPTRERGHAAAVAAGGAHVLERCNPIGNGSSRTSAATLRMRIWDLAKSRLRYGHFRIYHILR
ncbi:hypothetical protein ABIE45_003454 [Methylobacterium sp. OAE515]